jgi:hypothetical protein
MSFFRVSLVCEAASHIGCGTRARPVLADLEREAAVREAWLSRDGTALGIVWNDEACDAGRAQSILRRHGVVGFEQIGPERQRSYDSFVSGGWCRSMQMQDLSAEEARVIAARLIRRLGQSVPLPAGAGERLAERLEDACARALAVASASCASTRREQIAAALLDAGRDLLDPPIFQAFAAVVSLGHRPLPGEG